MPSTPYDAKGLLRTAVRQDNPLLFMKHKGLYRTKGMVPEEEYTIPLGKADVKREGNDVTIIATSMMVSKALTAGGKLAKEGIEIEAIDPGTLVPLDTETVLDSIKKTGKLVILEEAVKRRSVEADIASIVVEQALGYLDAPIVRLGAPSVAFPFSSHLERLMTPTEEDLIKAVREILA